MKITAEQLTIHVMRNKRQLVTELQGSFIAMTILQANNSFTANADKAIATVVWECSCNASYAELIEDVSIQLMQLECNTRHDFMMNALTTAVANYLDDAAFNPECLSATTDEMLPDFKLWLQHSESEYIFKKNKGSK
jgi:hypothetical protein